MCGREGKDGLKDGLSMCMIMLQAIFADCEVHHGVSSLQVATELRTLHGARHPNIVQYHQVRRPIAKSQIWAALLVGTPPWLEASSTNGMSQWSCLISGE
jgi:hypothetical protein